MNNQLIAMHEPFALEYLERLASATTKERAEARSLFNEKNKDEHQIYSVDGSVAKMIIAGPLSRKGPSAIARYFGYGGTGYNAIIKAANDLESNNSIKHVNIEMDTPGGFLDGLDEAFQALNELSKTKKVTAINRGMIASAGYYLAVAASKIEATSPAVVTGSIGVKVVGYDWSGYYKENGIVRRVIISDGAPNKAADLETKKGRDIILKEINAQERIFHMRVSEGRGISVETVKQNFGRGGILVAFDPDPSIDDALSVGMIDELTGGKIGVFEENENSSESQSNIKENKKSLVKSFDKNKSLSKRSQKKCGQTSASDQETHIVSTLKELLAENPGIQAEYDAALANAKTTGFTAGKVEGLAQSEAELKGRVTVAKIALDAAKSYPKAITDLATKVMIGETDKTALEAAMASVDAVREENASNEASDESEKLGKTSGQQQSIGKIDGVAETEEDFQAQLKSAKSGSK